MKGLKKLLTGILAGALSLTMVLSAGTTITAKAAETGSITVSNTTQGETYTLFKVFDATYTGSGADTKVAYTYDGSNNDFLANLQAATDLFEVVSNGESYNVIAKDTANDESILAFIKENKDNFGSAIASLEGNGTAIVFKNLAFGYYYITSSLGTVVTINSAVPDATVIDKNQKTTVDKQESVEIDNNNELIWKYIGQGTVENPIPTQAVGAKVNYQLTGTITQYVGEKKVTYLTFTDTLSTGLTSNEDVTVTINGNVVDANVLYNGQKTTITVNTVDDSGNFIYDSNAEYVITYSATVNADALGEVKNNTVTLTDNNGNNLGTDKTEVVDYKITLTKEDAADNQTKLAGAKFRLYTSENGTDEIKVVLVSGTGDATSIANNVYRVAMDNEVENAVEMVTGTTGIIEVKGLKNGSYYFEETEAPEGYNKLTARTVAVTITNADATYTVKNNSGSLLPSTGGIGTTIFYIIGAILIVAGVAYFIVRRKADAE